MMTARLERHIYSGFFGCGASHFQRMYFSVRLPRALMPARTDHLPVAHDYAADPRVWTCAIQALFREPESLGHIGVVSR